MREEFSSAKSVPEIMKGMLDFSHLLEKSGTDEALAELVKTRASQINGARRIHMRAIDGRDGGERGDNLLAGWRWSPLYSDRERAALAWTEALTVMAEGHAPDAAFAELRRQLLRSGAGAAHADDCHRQCLEPRRDRSPPHGCSDDH